MLTYSTASAADVPMALLLEADPSEARIRSYLADSLCFVARANEEVLGACIVQATAAGTAEIHNVAVAPSAQRRGIGSALLRYTLSELSARGFARAELGTGCFGYQLTYYQRLGFRVDTVIKDHFIEHYPEPIFESGIQHRDMLRLYTEL